MRHHNLRFSPGGGGIGLLGLLALLLAGCIPPLPPGPGQAGLPLTLTPTAGPTLPALHITTATGADVAVYVEIARTPEEQQRGLMNRPSLPADQGMLFDFGGVVQESFWMHNTLIPLSIAWFTQDGVIVDIQEMEAQTDTLHTPKAPYWYALEANKGFFAQHGVQPGDKVTLPK